MSFVEHLIILRIYSCGQEAREAQTSQNGEGSHSLTLVLLPTARRLTDQAPGQRTVASVRLASAVPLFNVRLAHVAHR